LPRVDVLNLLSVYTGYKNWEDLVSKKKAQGVLPEVQDEQSNIQKMVWAGISVVVLIAAVGTVAILALWDQSNQFNYRLCFEDADLGTPIPGNRIEIKVLQANAIGRSLSCDPAGCATINLDRDVNWC
ncbi:MAG: hypothetical protein COA57_13485, partial [Flavobacteriales bacterium]